MKLFPNPTEGIINIKVTASFGVATFGEDATSKDELLRAVDEAMYRVKETSKDAVALAGSPAGGH